MPKSALTAQEISANVSVTRSPRAGAEKPVLGAARITAQPPVIDGQLDDAAWRDAPVSTPFVQREPVAGAAPSERTDVRVMFDDETLYIGARLFDSAPDSVVTILARRDLFTQSDQFVVALDTYHDQRTAFVFRIVARGSRSDWIVTNGRDLNFSWDPVWSVETAQDSLGWTAEMAIPLSQLRFTDQQDGRRIWGLNFFRHIARRGEWDHWSLVPSDASEEVLHYGELHDVPVPPRRRLEIMPYVLTEAARAAPGSGAVDGLTATIGGDMQLGLGRNLTLTGTINPDFGQVEADPSQVNLSGQETLFEERRPFFVEGGDLFAGFFPQLFYSRRIGRAPQGAIPAGATEAVAPRSARVLGAAKLTGKTADGWSIAVLNALTQRAEAEYRDADGLRTTRELEPRTNYFVSRVGRELNQGWTRIGVAFNAVNRDVGEPSTGFLASGAYTGGFDVMHRFGDGGALYLRSTLFGSHVTGNTAAITGLQRAFLRYYQRPDARHVDVDSAATSLTGYAAFLRLGRESNGNMRWGVGAAARSPGFEINDAGYQTDADTRMFFGWLGWEDYEADGIFRRKAFWLNANSQWDFGGTPIARMAFLRSELQFTNYWQATVYLERWLGGFDPRALRGGPALRREPGGLLRADISGDRRNPIYATLGLVGQSYDESDTRSGSFAPGIVVRPTPGSEISLTPSIGWNHNPAQFVGAATVADRTHWIVGRVRQTTAAIVARANYTFSPTLSFQAYAQPFVSAARFDRLAEVTSPRAREFNERFRKYAAPQIVRENGERRIDHDADGSFDVRLAEPDFSRRDLNASAVLRWEYRPGSTAYFVWSHGRTATSTDGTFDLERDAQNLFGLPSRNTLLVKFSYWIN